LFAGEFRIDLVVLDNVFGDSMRAGSSSFFQCLDGSSDHSFERRMIFLGTRFGGLVGCWFSGHCFLLFSTRKLGFCLCFVGGKVEKEVFVIYFFFFFFLGL